MVQLYLGMPDKVKVFGSQRGELVDFPVRVLRAFEKVELEKGEKKTVKLELARKDLSYWCVVRQNWVLPSKEEGLFTVWVGNSSRKLAVKFQF